MGAVQAFSALSDRAHVVTIGNFDGVHRGHQHLLSLVTAHAQDLGVRSLVITFEPHPVAVLRPEYAPRRISTPLDKVARLREYGIDDVAVIPFDREFASWSPEAFLTLILTHAQPGAILVGPGFRFGKMRAGDIQTIEEFGRTHGFECHTIEPWCDEDGIVSSSRVREALATGNVDTASRLLGRRFRLSGIVEHGLARGRELGYPTANLSVPDGLCVPHDGIYAGYSRFDVRQDLAHEALMYIGTSPTFGDRARLVEVNILDYQSDLYGHELEIEFVEFVRPDQMFDTADALVAQMTDDEARSRQILSKYEPESTRRGN